MTPPQASGAAVGGPTPGPWKAVFNNWSRYEIHYAGGQLAMVARWDDPASPPPIPEMHANARLIAAAPDSHAANIVTVAALREVYRITDDADDQWIYDELGTELSSAYFMARAAIAKATSP